VENEVVSLDFLNTLRERVIDPDGLLVTGIQRGCSRRDARRISGSSTAPAIYSR